LPRIIKGAGFGRRSVEVGRQPFHGFTPSFVAGVGLAPETEANAAALVIDAEEIARAKADQIMAEAESNAVDLRMEASTQGYAEGMAQGLRAAQEQCQEYLERIAELARRAAIDREAMVRSAERDLASLAMEVAAKVIQRELSVDPSIVLSMVERALAKVAAGDSVRIMVHPEDAELVRDKWTEMRGAVAFGPNWEVVGDERMERGGCVVETRGGMVDSRIDAQLTEIANVFEVTP